MGILRDTRCMFRVVVDLSFWAVIVALLAAVLEATAWERSRFLFVVLDTP